MIVTVNFENLSMIRKMIKNLGHGGGMKCGFVI